MSNPGAVRDVNKQKSYIMNTKYFKLSPYTVAKKCTDISDCQAGIDEIKQAIKTKEMGGGVVPLFWYVRFGKLQDKLKILTENEPAS